MRKRADSVGILGLQAGEDVNDGQIYSQGVSRHPWGYEAVQTKAGMQLRSLHAHVISHELFDPSLVFSPDEGLAVAQIEVAWRDRSMINHEEAPESLPSL